MQISKPFFHSKLDEVQFTVTVTRSEFKELSIDAHFLLYDIETKRLNPMKLTKKLLTYLRDHHAVSTTD